MNKTILSIAITGIVLIFIANYYLSSATMSSSVENDEMMEHSDELKSYEISPGLTVQRMRSGEDVILLDVRTSEEYEEVHLEGALLLPVQVLSQQSLAQIGLGENTKDKEIILYCRSGARSKIAYDIMTSLGYTNLKMIAGGMIHWEEDQYPLTETGAYTGPSEMSASVKVENNQGGAKIALNQTLHDFGIITQYGGTVQTDFIITNNGTKILEIGDISTSCSCTSAVVDNYNIEPNESATLTVVFDPDYHAEPSGAFKRTVFIPTNDPSIPEAEVSIQVYILEGE